MRLLALALAVASRFPLERLFTKPLSNRKRLEELSKILDNGRAKQEAAPPESPGDFQEEGGIAHNRRLGHLFGTSGHSGAAW